MTLPLSLFVACASTGAGKPDDTAPSVEAAVAEAECASTPRAKISLSTNELAFGRASPGSPVTRSLEVTNTGSHALGVTGVRIVDEEFVDFDVTVGTADCADTVDGDKGGDRVTVLRLAPGCAVPVEVTYTPSIPGGSRAALVVESDAGVQPVDDSFVPDVLHASSVVWLSGETDGRSEADDPEIVAISSSQTAIWEGESVQLEVRVRGHEPVSFVWQDDDGGTFDDPTSPMPVYTAPSPIAHGGKNVTLYAVALDVDANQDYAYFRLEVHDESEGLYCPDLPPR